MAGRWHNRTGRESSHDKLSRIARPAGWAGMVPGARHHATRSNTSANISSPPTPPLCPWSILTAGPIETNFDLYDQAFALLAYASGHRAFGEAGGWRRQALALRQALTQFYAHPLGGFLEDRSGRLPQRSNPHMHLLEATLAWIPLDDDPAWRRMSDAIATLCLEKFIDPATGALREFFAADWSPAPGLDGRICEPGHHYEWAFLLDRWARLTGRPTPEAAARLIAFADSSGVDPHRGVVINAVLTDGSIHDPVARLWAQAERIRAYLAHRHTDEEIAAAIKGLRRFLATPTPGLWFDQLTAADTFIHEPARATSLYHIIGAVCGAADGGS